MKELVRKVSGDGRGVGVSGGGEGVGRALGERAGDEVGGERMLERCRVRGPPVKTVGVYAGCNGRVKLALEG